MLFEIEGCSYHDFSEVGQPNGFQPMKHHDTHTQESVYSLVSPHNGFSEGGRGDAEEQGVRSELTVHDLNALL